MAYKPLWDWMDKQEGRKDSSYENLQKEKKRQMARKMDKNNPVDRFRKGNPSTFPSSYK